MPNGQCTCMQGSMCVQAAVRQCSPCCMLVCAAHAAADRSPRLPCAPPPQQSSKGMPDVLVNFPDAFRRQVRRSCCRASCGQWQPCALGTSHFCKGTCWLYTCKEAHALARLNQLASDPCSSRGGATRPATCAACWRCTSAGRCRLGDWEAAMWQMGAAGQVPLPRKTVVDRTGSRVPPHTACNIRPARCITVCSCHSCVLQTPAGPRVPPRRL